jgi:cupin fold WbuC family metalloprotein
MLIPIDEKLINKLKSEAKKSERKRITYRFHKKYSDKVQRMLNVMCKGTYTQPHAHITPPKVEVFLILEGKAVLIEYSKSGKITNKTILNRINGVYGAEISPKTIHSIIPLSDVVVLYEIKKGPYSKKSDKVFAKFAPSEEEGGAGTEFNKKILKEL